MESVRDLIPESFPDTGEGAEALKRKPKEEEFTASRTTMNDPEYLTLHKLLSFLHAALLMKGEMIAYGDLTRYKLIISNYETFRDTCYLLFQMG